MFAWFKCNFCTNKFETKRKRNKADYFNEQLPRVTTPQPEAGLG